MFKAFTFLLIAFIGFLSTTSCVSKKRLEAETTMRDSLNQLLNHRLLACNQQIGTLELQLAEKTGEGNALRELYDKKEKVIKQLEQEMESRSSQSLTNQQKLDLALQKKDAIIGNKEEQLQSLRNEMDELELRMKKLKGTMAVAFQDLKNSDFTMEVKGSELHIRIPEKLLFKPGSIGFESGAVNLLERLSTIFLQQPDLHITIECHTDNSPPKSRAYSDNWDLSSLRSATLVRTMTKEFGMPTNQLTPVGKGEFEPTASNETEEGRTANRRVEFIVAGSYNKLLKMIRETGS